MARSVLGRAGSSSRADNNRPTTKVCPRGWVYPKGIGVYQALTSWKNLRLAYHKAAKGKRGQPNVATFEYHLEENLFQLQAELRQKTYRPGRYTNFMIHEPKRRLISAAPFADRVTHHALCNLIEPIFERGFIYDSYAHRVGKGTHRALDRCQQFARRYRYVLSCDIRQFFPSVDHQILQSILAKKIDDPDVMWLIQQILAGGAGVLTDQYTMVYFADDDLLASQRPRGLPIGNLTSQFWANCYLNPLDQFIKRELGCKGYLRYVDDFMLFADDKATLWRWLEAIQARLISLRLTIHPRAHPRPVTEGIPFLGFVVYPQTRRLKRRKGIHFQRRFKQKRVVYQQGQLTLDDLTASVQGWLNHVRYGNTVGLQKAMLHEAIIPPKRTMV